MGFAILACKIEHPALCYTKSLWNTFHKIGSGLSRFKQNSLIVVNQYFEISSKSVELKATGP